MPAKAANTKIKMFHILKGINNIFQLKGAFCPPNHKLLTKSCDHTFIINIHTFGSRDTWKARHTNGVS